MHPFVGRRAELAMLNDALDAAIAGRTSAILVSGEPGIGKTRLVEELRGRARERGAHVALARPWDGGGAPPFAPIAQLASELLDAIGDGALEDVVDPRALAAVAPSIAHRLRVEPATALEPFRVHDAVARLFAALARRRVLVLAIDDLHACDPSTLGLLRYLIRTLRDARLLLVGTLRAQEDAAAEDARRALRELTAEATILPLGGLDEAAVREWVGRDRGDAAHLWRKSAGNPLFIDGALRAPAGSAVAADVHAAIARRIEALPPSARRLLDAAAVIGRPASLALLARTLAVPFAELLEPAGLAASAGLLVESGPVGEHRFFHPLVQEVTYGALGPRGRAELHAAVASALEALHGAELALHGSEHARHLLAAAPLGGADRAMIACHAAGRRAMDLAAFAVAARHFDDAGRAAAFLAPEAPWPIAREALLLDLAEARLLAGEREAARAGFDAAAAFARAHGRPEALATAALGYARSLEFGAHEPRRLARLEEAADALAGAGPSAQRARVLARLAQELWMVPGAEARRAGLADEAIAMAEAVGDDGALAYALDAWLQTVWSPELRAEREARAEQLARVAARSDDLELRLQAHRWRINLAVEAGEMARAEAAIADYAAVASALRRPDYLANARMREAMLPQHRGETDAALALGAQTRELARAAGDPQADIVHDAFRVLTLAEADREGALLEALPALRAHVDTGARHAIYRAILALGLARAGRLDEARVEWERLFSADLADVSRDMFWPSVLAALAGTCLALEDRERAGRLIELLTPLAPLNAAIGASGSLGAVAGWLGLLCAFLGRRDEAIPRLEQGIAANERMGALWRASRLAAALASLRGPEAPAVVASRVERAALVRDGALWRVEHAGRTGHVKDALGVGYLKTLLERPGVEVAAGDLAASVPSEGALPRIDETARRVYRARIVALREELAEAESFADLGRAERARSELAALTAELTRAYGLGGRARATGSSTERARTRVQKALRRAIAAIGEALPELGQHLERAVRTGAFCAYDPEPRSPIEWTLGP